ncbi:hypothetical protein [Yoonia litorea]|uniref:DUF1311 domain-containing protein n=1 Tax=Yoonia litorea TaxID=1123755 RepID=A0A1I6LTC2_9RHOB|nr:hypothetical protein [Yoonia litorea]SFS06522.1 hypothetical protein SAMN05444714_0862 [Yoonia litorea]
MMRQLIFAVVLPVAVQAQDFGPLPTFTLDGVVASADEVHACIEEQAALGANALVGRNARDCIGREVDLCTAAREACAALEQSYWEWRIARTYDGLQAWVDDRPDVAASVQTAVANPAAATANVPLECQLRIAEGQGDEAAPSAMATCMMRETALIAVELEFSVREACETAETGAFAAYCGRN